MPTSVVRLLSYLIPEKSMSEEPPPRSFDIVASDVASLGSRFSTGDVMPRIAAIRAVACPRSATYERTVPVPTGLVY